MKKLLLFAALVLGMASCQTEPEGLDVVVGGEQEVMLNVSLPESTRMASSAGFDFNNFVSNTKYDLRFILEIAHNGKVVRTVKTSNTTSATFPVRLAPDREYTFTVWADLVNDGTQDDLYYNILSQNKADDESVLNNITFNDNWTPNVEARDAYTFTTTKEFKAGETNLTMNLTRPFAKVRVVATDIEDVRKFDIEPDNAVVTYNVDMYTSFNAVTGVAGVAEATEFEYTINPEAYEEETGKLTVFADYIFVPADGTVKFDLVINDGNAKIKENNFNTTIPVVANKVTSIVGDVLTLGGNVSITVNNGIEQNETINFVDSAESLIDAINAIEEGKSGNIKLGGDVDLNDLLSAGILATRAESQYGIQIPAGKSVVLDLNGKRVFQEKACSSSYSMIQNAGNLTITGEGTIEFTNTAEGGDSTWGTYTIENRGEGVLTIDNANIRHNGCVNGEVNRDTNIAIQNYQGKVVVNGGTIASTQFRSLRDFTAGGEIIINGGTFLGQVWMQGLGNGSSSLTINGGNFSPVEGYDGSSVYITNSSNIVNVAVKGGMFNTKIGCYDANKEGAKGCITAGEFTTAAMENTNAALIAEGHAFKALENGNYTVAMTEEAKLRKVLAEGGELTLEEDITITAQLEVTTTEAIVVNGNGKTITYTGATRAFNVNRLDTANVTLNNLAFVSEKYNERCINFNVDGKLTLNNVTTGATGTPATYAINLPGSSDGAEVVINNSNIRGHIALNIWGENVVVTATDTIFSNYDPTEVEDYTTIVLNNDGSTVAEGAVVKINGGKVIGENEKGEPLHAVNNGTVTGVVNISETTEVIGAIKETVAIVDYNSTSFYSFTTLQGAIDKVCKDKSGFVRLVKDITVDETITIPAKGDVTIDLNGKTITGTDSATSSFGLITNQGTLTVKNGTMTLKAENNRGWNAYSSVISNNPGGNLVVENATIEHLGGTDMAYGIDNLTNGKGTSAIATVNDGAVVKSTYRAIRQFLNGIEATNELTVNAGAVVEGANKSIWMQDPSANANTGKLVVNEGATLKGDVYLFVCAGSTSWPVEVSIAAAALAEGSKVLTGNVPAQYEVVEENGVWVVNQAYDAVATTTAELQAALAEGKKTLLANDLTITPEEMTTAPYGNKMALSQNGGIFNGNGKNLSVTANGDNYVVMTNGGTIKNLDIDRGFRGIVLMYPNQDVYVENVKIGVDDEVCYTINTAEGDGTHSLYVSNSVLNGWCSIGTAVKDVYFTNCTFGQGTYYTNVYGRLVKPYVDAVFNGCDFCDKCYIDLSAFVGTKVTVKNCTVNGVKITAENWTSLVAPEDTCGEGQISVELKNGTYLTAENVADYIVFE